MTNIPSVPWWFPMALASPLAALLFNLPQGGEQAANAEARAKEVAYVNRFLAERSMPPVRVGTDLQQHGGWVYELTQDRFVLARRLGDVDARAAMPVAEGRGELVWLYVAGGAWHFGSPVKRVRPADGSVYFQSHSIPSADRWARALKLDPRRTHYFTVLQCERTHPQAAEVNSTATWELEAWFVNAARVEEAFRKGRLGVR